MSMTGEERQAQQEIYRILLNYDDDGNVIDPSAPHYVRYARLFMLFELHLVSSGIPVAAMLPQKGVILLNRYCDLAQTSTFVRHEILHEYFTHYERIIAHVGGLDKWDSIRDVAVEISNIAGDFDISNQGYTEKDKEIMRNIKQYGKDGKIYEVIQGLVTEDSHPDWLNLSFEEMYDKLMEERDKAEKDAEQSKKNQDQTHSQDYIDGWTKAIQDYQNGKLKL